MPPEDEVKTWTLVFYQMATDDRSDAEKYWMEYAKRYYDTTKSLIKPNDEVKKMAATLIADAKTDDEKLERLFEFCRTKIKNASFEASGLTPEERAKVKDNKNPSDTLKRGVGSMRRHRSVVCSTRECIRFRCSHRFVARSWRSVFRQAHPERYFISPMNIGVNVGGTWKFFNPGYSYIPYRNAALAGRGPAGIDYRSQATGLG